MKNSKTLTGLLDFSLVAFIVFIIMMMMFWSCKHEPLVPLLPAEHSGPGSTPADTFTNNSTPCDPDTVYFENDILPLFISNCAKGGCHDAVTHEKDIVLDSYSHIMGSGEVRAGDPSEGKIVEMITETDPDKIMPPPPNNPLSSPQVNMIISWINQGALNNSCSGDCDTLNVTYALTVVPILQSKCTGCHNSATTSGNVNLSNYAGVQLQALNGRLSGAVNHEAGYSAMPKGGSKLPPCEIDELRIWIENGALNN
jgi:hypothetical protein